MLIRGLFAVVFGLSIVSTIAICGSPVSAGPGGVFCCAVNHASLIAHPTPLPTGAAFLGGVYTQKPEYVSSKTEIEQNAEILECGSIGCSTPGSGGIGRRLAFIDEYYFSDNLTQAAVNSDPVIQGDLKYGRMPLISWAPKVSLATFYNGQDNADIDNAAMALKSLGVPVIFRPFHEMTQCMPISAGGKVGPTTTSCPNSDYPFAFAQGDTLAQAQTEFISYWKYIYNRMVNVDGATNILWAPCPAVGQANPLTPAQTAGFLPTSSGQPGVGSIVDVDYICIDSYDVNAQYSLDGVLNLPYSTPGAAGGVYQVFSQYGIPIIWAETADTAYTGATNPNPTPAPLAPNGSNQGACTPNTGSNSVAAYFNNMVSELPTNYPLIAGIGFFDSWPTYPNCQREWLPDAAGLSAFTTLAQNSYFSAMGGTVATPTPAPSPTPTPNPTPTPTPTPTPNCSDPECHYVIQPPSSGKAYIGIFNPVENTNCPTTCESATTYFGKQFDQETIYLSLFSGTTGSVTAGTVSSIGSGTTAGEIGAWYTSGEIPIIGIRCEAPNASGVTFTGIENGNFDSQIDQDAAGLKALLTLDPAGRGYAFARLFYEMDVDLDNGNSGAACFSSGSGVTLASQEAEFQGAWQHIVTRLVQHDGVLNVSFVFNPTVGNGSSGCNSTKCGTTTIEALYPGNAYVDWVGPDGYDKNGSGLTGVFGASNPYGDPSQLFASWNKPVIIPETGEVCSTATDTQGNTCASYTGPTQKTFFSGLQAAVTGSGGLLPNWSVTYYNEPGTSDWVFDSPGKSQYLSMASQIGEQIGTNVVLETSLQSVATVTSATPPPQRDMFAWMGLESGGGIYTNHNATAAQLESYADFCVGAENTSLGIFPTQCPGPGQWGYTNGYLYYSEATMGEPDANGHDANFPFGSYVSTAAAPTPAPLGPWETYFGPATADSMAHISTANLTKWGYYCQGSGSTTAQTGGDSGGANILQCAHPYFYTNFGFMEPNASGATSVLPWTGNLTGSNCPSAYTSADFAKSTGTDGPDWSLDANDWGVFEGAKTDADRIVASSGAGSGNYYIFLNLNSASLLASVNAGIAGCSYEGYALNGYEGVFNDNGGIGLTSAPWVPYGPGMYNQHINWGSANGTPYASLTGLSSPSTFFSGAFNTTSSQIDSNPVTGGNTTYGIDTGSGVNLKSSFTAASQAFFGGLKHANGAALDVQINDAINGYMMCQMVNGVSNVTGAIRESATSRGWGDGRLQNDATLQSSIDVASEDYACGGGTFILHDYFTGGDNAEYLNGGTLTTVTGAGKYGTPQALLDVRAHVYLEWLLWNDKYPQMIGSFTHACNASGSCGTSYKSWTDVYDWNFAVPSGRITPYPAQALASNGQYCSSQSAAFNYEGTGQPCAQGGARDTNICAAGTPPNCLFIASYAHLWTWNYAACPSGPDRTKWNSTCTMDIGPFTELYNLSGSTQTLSPANLAAWIGSTQYGALKDVLFPGCQPTSSAYSTTAGQPFYVGDDPSGTAAPSTSVVCSGTTQADVYNADSSMGSIPLSSMLGTTLADGEAIGFTATAPSASSPPPAAGTCNAAATQSDGDFWKHTTSETLGGVSYTVPDWTSIGTDNWGLYANGGNIGNALYLIAGYNGSVYRFPLNPNSPSLLAYANDVIANCAYSSVYASAGATFDSGNPFRDNVYIGFQSQGWDKWDRYPTGIDFGNGIAYNGAYANPGYAENGSAFNPGGLFNGAAHTRTTQISTNDTPINMPSDTSWKSAETAFSAGLKHANGSPALIAYNGFLNTDQTLNKNPNTRFAVLEEPLVGCSGTCPSPQPLPYNGPTQFQINTVLGTDLGMKQVIENYSALYNEVVLPGINTQIAGVLLADQTPYICTANCTSSTPTLVSLLGTGISQQNEMWEWAPIFGMFSDAYPDMTAEWSNMCGLTSSTTIGGSDCMDSWQLDWAMPSGRITPYPADATAADGTGPCSEYAGYDYEGTGKPCAIGGPYDSNIQAAGIAGLYRFAFHHLWMYETSAKNSNCTQSGHNRKYWKQCAVDLGAFGEIINATGGPITITSADIALWFPTIGSQLQYVLTPCNPNANYFGSGPGAPIYAMPSDANNDGYGTGQICTGTSGFDIPSGGTWSASKLLSDITTNNQVLYDGQVLYLVATGAVQPPPANGAYIYNGVQVYTGSGGAPDPVVNADLENPNPAPTDSNSTSVINSISSKGATINGGAIPGEIGDFQENLANDSVARLTVGCAPGGCHSPIFPSGAYGGGSGQKMPWQTGFAIQPSSDHHGLVLVNAGTDSDVGFDYECYHTNWSGTALSAFACSLQNLGQTFTSNNANAGDNPTAAGIPFLGFTDFGEDASLSSINHPLQAAANANLLYSVSGVSAGYARGGGFTGNTCATPNPATKCLEMGDVMLLVNPPSFFTSTACQNAQSQKVLDQLYRRGLVITDNQISTSGITPRFGLDANGGKDWNSAVWTCLSSLPVNTATWKLLSRTYF